MTLQQLKYLIEVADKGSINKAAKSLYISQPSLSNAIRELEEEVNITIFNRTNRGVVLTDEGAEFLAYARKVVEQAKLLERFVEKRPLKQRFGVSTQHYSVAILSFSELIKEYGTESYEFWLRENKVHEIIKDVRDYRSEVGIVYLNKLNERTIKKHLEDNNLEFEELNVCSTCHTEEFAREWLGYADEMAEYTLNRMREAKGMLEELKKDGLIRPTMEVTNAHPIAGQLSAVESYFFQVNMATNRARKGAYHMSSQWAGRQGWTDQSFGLMEFRSEVERLRTDAEREKRIQELEELIEKLNK